MPYLPFINVPYKLQSCNVMTYPHPQGHQDMCLVTIFSKGNDLLIIISQYLSKSSVTNSIETITSYVIHNQLGIAGKPNHKTTFIEHYPNDQYPRPAGGDFSEVTFKSHANNQYISPSWHHETKKELESILGWELDHIHTAFTNRYP